MKFLQIGLGSMGKRRIRNLLHNKVSSKSIAGFDLSQERRAEVIKLHNITVFDSFEKAVVEFKPDVFIISTPPHLHDEYFLYAAKNGIDFFVEVATADKGYQKLQKLLEKSDIVAAPSCNFRYFKPIVQMKNLLDKNAIGQIQAFTHHMGQYLPDWHPWENYKKFYVSQSESSACREMVPFELSWLQWLLNCEIISAKGVVDKCSNLDLKIPDTYAAALHTNNHIVGTLVVDVISRYPLRSLRILGSEGVLEWDWQRRTIAVYSAQSKKWKLIKTNNGQKRAEYTATTEDMYNKEIKVFLESLKNKKAYPYSFAEDQHNFDLLREIEKTSGYFK